MIAKCLIKYYDVVVKMITIFSKRKNHVKHSRTYQSITARIIAV